jgi:translation initiation factor 1
MGKSKKKNIVYSTNPDFEYEDLEDENIETLPANEQKLYVSIDRKQRKGKEVTLVEGFIGRDDDLKELAKTLKSSCGVGGSAKEGVVLIQGNFKQKVADLLKKNGYQVKLKGGG